MHNALLKLLGLFTLAGGFFLGWLWLDMQSFLNRPMKIPDTSFTYTVEPGATLYAVAQDLHQANILSRPYYLVWEAKRQAVANRIKAGEYEIRPGTTPLTFLQMLIDGRVVQYAVTFIEGWTFDEVTKALATHPKLTHTLQEQDRKTIMMHLGHPEMDAEGMFYPDTYLFSTGTPDTEILKRAFDQMQEKLERAWQARDADLPYRSSYDALIMASLIEKETAKPEERPDIAGVFVRRLKRGMLLQTDPTVVYALGKQFDGNLKRNDLLIDNPYNTYRFMGLPPTPIAMTSESSIHAALHPAAGETLYFVAKGDGSHHFSATIEEHDRAVSQYQIKPAKKAWNE